MKMININIWDDFYEDGDVPADDTQETYLYVEENIEDCSDEEQKDILEKILPQFQNLLKGTEVQCVMNRYDTKELYPYMKEDESGWKHNARWEMRLTPITHKQLATLLEKIEQTPLEIPGIELNVYSES